ncbi:MAG: serine/threonine protein kinase, partial [Myxococcota bacterium]|nr:serine/threonine protein kinase [Myxococcota bacterium]
MTTRLIADRFRIEEQVGTSALSKVYRAVQEPLDRHVALKLLDPELADDPAARRRFFREARSVARLSHPNVAHVHDFGETDDFQL